MIKINAREGNRFVLTEEGYRKTPDKVKSERKVGSPIKNYETSVPKSWIEKGYVTEE